MGSEVLTLVRGVRKVPRQGLRFVLLALLDNDKPEFENFSFCTNKVLFGRIIYNDACEVCTK